MSADYQEALADKADALTDVWAPGSRVALFTEPAVDSEDAVDLLALVKARFQKARRFQRDTGQVAQTLTVFPTRALPMSTLLTVSAYAILERDRETGERTGWIQRCSPDGGVPLTGDELFARWRSDVRIGTTKYVYGAVASEALAYVNGADVPYVNGSGSQYVTD